MKAGAGRARPARGSIVQGLRSRRTIRMACGSTKSRLRCRGGEILGIAGVAGNGQDELFAALSGERLTLELGRRGHRRQAAGQLSVTERRRLGAAFVPEERLGHGTAPRMKSVGQRAADRPCRERHGQATASSTGRPRSPWSTAPPSAFDVRKAKRDPEAVSLSGRQSAEIHGRPRNPARARRAGGQPADLGRRCGSGRRPSARR